MSWWEWLLLAGIAGIFVFFIWWDLRESRSSRLAGNWHLIEIYFDDDGNVVKIGMNEKDLRRVVRKHISEIPKPGYTK